MAKENIEKELNTIYSELDTDKLVLPNFQRGFVWDRNKQKSLLASILVDLPVGNLLLLQGTTDDFSKRRLCFPDDYTLEQKTNCEFVLDGQQRLSSLRSMFYDLFKHNWLSVWEKIYGDLRTRWFIKIYLDDTFETQEHDDVFGYKWLNFSTLETLTDGDIENYIEYKPIHKTKASEPYHPNFQQESKNGSDLSEVKIRDNKAEYFAKDGLVPLWEVSNGRNGIHRKTLSKISDIRIKELKIKAEESSHSLEFYKNVFAPIDPSYDDIKFKLEESQEALGNIDDNLFIAEWASLKALWIESVASELEKIPFRKMAIIQLTGNEVSRAVAIFEAINKGGIPLSVYDLVVAKSAQNNSVKNLSAKIIETISRGLDISQKLRNLSNNRGGLKFSWSSDVLGIIEGNEPSKILKEWFVNILSIIVYTKEMQEQVNISHIKKEKILKLRSSDVNVYSSKSIEAIIRALAFLQFRCGVISAKEVPYKLMVVVLAIILENDEFWNDEMILNKIEYWYWSSLFGGAYSKSQNEQCITDIKNLFEFINDSNKNEFSKYVDKILNVPDYLTKEILLRKDDAINKETSSMAKGILQFILANNPSDFTLASNSNQTNLTAWDISDSTIEVEIHHIIPLGDKTTINESTKELRNKPSELLNSTLNLSYISKKSNRDLSDTSPKKYLELLNGFSADSHYFPSNISEIESRNADKNDFYENVLSDRYESLKQALNNRLRKLLI